MFKNKIILGVFAGLTATIVKDAINQTLYSLTIMKTLFAEYASGVFVSAMEARTMCGSILGYLIDFGLSSLFGIIFVFLLEKTKPKYIPFQGVLFGSALFIVIYGALISFGITAVKERTLSDAFIMIIIHFLYGLTLGIFVQKFGKSALGANLT
ncbi:MAG TPA: hypothetical protein DDW65_00335 [Firmicutes bacterium]|nr:hypothetical protein [Bacillota bacterium]